MIPKIDGDRAIAKNCVGFGATRWLSATRWFCTGSEVKFYVQFITYFGPRIPFLTIYDIWYLISIK